MNKEEREIRLKNHGEYYALIDKIREVSLDAIDDVLSVEDIISVLDRIKTELVQEQVIVEIEQSMKGSEEEEEELEIEEMSIQGNVKAGVPFVSPTEMMEEIKGGLLNN